MRKIYSLLLLGALMLLGAQNAFASTEVTVYFGVTSDFIASKEADESAVKLNVALTYDNNTPGDWHQYTMTKTAYTIMYNRVRYLVYSCTFTATYDGVGCMQFQLYNTSGGQRWNDELYYGWWGTSGYDNKLCIYRGEDTWTWLEDYSSFTLKGNWDGWASPTTLTFGSVVKELDSSRQFKVVKDDNWYGKGSSDGQYAITSSSTSVDGLIKDEKNIAITTISGTHKYLFVWDQGRFEVSVYYPHTINIGETGWTTFSCSDALDFTGISGINAYMVTGIESNDVTLTLTPVTGTIPANTGLLINGTPNSSVLVPVVAGSTTSTSANMLIAGKGTSVVSSAPEYYYVLSNQGGVLGFYELQSSATINEGKAYLHIHSEESEGAPSAIRIVDEENNATNINAIEASEEAVKFLQNGQLFIKKNGVVYDVTGRIVK